MHLNSLDFSKRSGQVNRITNQIRFRLKMSRPKWVARGSGQSGYGLTYIFSHAKYKVIIIVINMIFAFLLMQIR